MDINQLRAFQTVARTGSITEAARKLHRAPSSITTRIHQLEGELNQSLFLRIKNRLTLSSAGRRMLQHTEQLLPMFDRLETEMMEYGRGEYLSLGALDVALESCLPAAIGMFREQCPQVRLAVRQAPSEVLRDELTSGLLDVVLNDGPVEAANVQSEYVFSERLVLVTDPSMEKVSGSQDLKGKVIYGFQRNCSYRLKMERWLREGGVASPTIIDMESYSMMLASVSGGGGAAWIPQTFLRRMGSNTALREHDLGDVGQTALYFSWRENEYSDTLRHLINAVKTQGM